MFKTISVTLGTALLAAALLASSHTALAARGGNGGQGKAKPVTLTFGDATGDAIQSDGLGAYSGTINRRDGTLDLATGARSLYFDFSNVLVPGSFDPFGASASSGSFSDVELTVIGMDGPVGLSTVGTTTFEFRAPAPDGSGQTDWRVYFWGVTVDRRDMDGDGAADTYLLLSEAVSTNQARLAWFDGDIERRTGRGRGGGPPQDDGSRLAGTFQMPWTADVGAQ